MRAFKVLEGTPVVSEIGVSPLASHVRKGYAKPIVRRLRLENVVRGSGGSKKDSTFPNTNPFEG